MYRIFEHKQFIIQCLIGTLKPLILGYSLFLNTILKKSVDFIFIKHLIK